LNQRLLYKNKNFSRKEVILIKNIRVLFWLGIFVAIAFLSTSCFFLNRPPVIESTPVTTAKEGAVYTYEVKATDLDGDTLEYSLSVFPEGMNINSSTGVITWIPTTIGSYNVTVEVFDGSKLTTQSFSITVEKASLDSIVVLPSSMNLKVNESKTITSVTAYYDNGTSANIALNACTYESNKPTVVTVTNGVIKVLSSCTASTTAIIRVSYTEDSITKIDTVTVTVTVTGGG